MLQWCSNPSWQFTDQINPISLLIYLRVVRGRLLMIFKSNQFQSRLLYPDCNDQNVRCALLQKRNLIRNAITRSIYNIPKQLLRTNSRYSPLYKLVDSIVDSLLCIFLHFFSMIISIYVCMLKINLNCIQNKNYQRCYIDISV